MIKLHSYFTYTALLVACLFMSIQGFSLEKAQTEKRNGLKEKIISLAETNTTKTDNFKEIRSGLEKLIGDLMTEPSRPEVNLEAKYGAWQLIWTDDTEDLKVNNFFMTADRERSFQVILPENILYNFSEIKTLVGRYSAILKAVYESEKKNINLEFTTADFLSGDLGPAENFVELTTRKEAGNLDTFKIPFVSDKYPDGPVGAKGYTKTIYIDSELRIDTGANSADNIVDLFIYKKVDNFEPQAQPEKQKKN